MSNCCSCSVKKWLEVAFKQKKIQSEWLFKCLFVILTPSAFWDLFFWPWQVEKKYKCLIIIFIFSKQKQQQTKLIQWWCSVKNVIQNHLWVGTSVWEGLKCSPMGCPTPRTRTPQSANHENKHKASSRQGKVSECMFYINPWATNVCIFLVCLHEERLRNISTKCVVTLHIHSYRPTGISTPPRVISSQTGVTRSDDWWLVTFTQTEHNCSEIGKLCNTHTNMGLLYSEMF